jgi:hypothetical protein
MRVIKGTPDRSTEWSGRMVRNYSKYLSGVF